MIKITISDLLVQAIKLAGVKRVYGIAGDSLNASTEAIRRDKNIEWVHVRNEEVGAFAAGAEAHLTGSLAVCAGSCGPRNQPSVRVTTGVGPNSGSSPTP